jgi:hypothetical protein
VVNEAFGYLDGEVIGAEFDGFSFGADAGSWRWHELER